MTSSLLVGLVGWLSTNESPELVESMPELLYLIATPAGAAEQDMLPSGEVDLPFRGT